MNVSHASVHPVTVEAPPLQTEAANVPRLRMKDIQGMPGTIGGIFLRLLQFLFAVIALCVVGTTRDFSTATAFCYLVATAGLQSVTSTLTFAAASAAAGITVFIGNGIVVCSQNHCTQFETSIAMVFLCWFTALPSFLLNFWSLASQ